MKKIFVISVLMALAMNGFAYDFSAVCETGQTLYYHITSEEEHTVILTYAHWYGEPSFECHYDGFVAPEGDIVLPSVVSYNEINYSVTAIDGYTFASCHITSIFIPNSVETIDSTAFAICSYLSTILVDEENPTFYSENNALIRRADKKLIVGCKTTIIPDDVEIIGAFAFYCSGWAGDLVIPNSVRVIEKAAFAWSRFQGTLTLSDTLETIGYYAFAKSCFSGSLVIPNSVTEMGEHAFFTCQGFTGSLTLSSSLSTISNCAFAHCTFTGTLIIPNSVNHIGSFAFDEIGFSELVLGESVVTIGPGAFSGCNNFSGTLRLPISVTEIGQCAFTNTTFDEIYSPNTLPPTLASNSFSGCDANIPVHIPVGCIDVYQNAPGWNYFNNFVETEMNLEGEWYYEILNDDGSITYQHLEYAADTTIGNERPKIIIRSNTHYDRDEVITETTHEYIYEKNGKIYWWNKELEEFTVLYDLVAESGDEWEIKVGTESLIMHVDSVEYIDYDGQSYRTLHVSDAGNLFGGDIVCGIGHQTSFFPERLMRDTEGFSVTGLRCYWVDDELIFHGGDEDCDAIYTELHGIDETNGDTFTVYPNPANSVLFVETRHGTSLSATYRITNLMGHTVLQGIIHGETQQIDIANLPAGVYFVNVTDEEGRKCVRKVVKE